MLSEGEYVLKRQVGHRPAKRESQGEIAVSMAGPPAYQNGNSPMVPLSPAFPISVLQMSDTKVHPSLKRLR